MLNFYVNTDTGNNDNDGLSPETAWKSQEYASYKLSYAVEDEIRKQHAEAKTEEEIEQLEKLLSTPQEPITIHCSGSTPDVSHVSYDAIKTTKECPLLINCSPEYTLVADGDRHALVVKTGYLEYKGGSIKGDTVGTSVPVLIGKFTEKDYNAVPSITIETEIEKQENVEGIKNFNPNVVPKLEKVVQKNIVKEIGVGKI